MTDHWHPLYMPLRSCIQYHHHNSRIRTRTRSTHISPTLSEVHATSLRLDFLHSPCALSVECSQKPAVRSLFGHAGRDRTPQILDPDCQKPVIRFDTRGLDRPPSTTITRTSEACPPRAVLKLNRTCPQHAPTAPLVCGEHTFSASRDTIADSVPVHVRRPASW